MSLNEKFFDICSKQKIMIFMITVNVQTITDFLYNLTYVLKKSVLNLPYYKSNKKKNNK